ncbi:MAG: saccharopine dehydrogenase family protein, partial [bacterium]
PGTTKTMVEGLPGGGRIRRDGRVVQVPAAYKIETIPFTAELSATAVTIPWGDVSTAFYSTGIPNIEVFLGASDQQIKQMTIPGFLRRLIGLKLVQILIKGQIARRVKGPTDEQRARDETYIYGEVWDDAGHRVALRLRTREAYTLTAESAVTATLEVMTGSLAPGAYTPAMAFGADYVLQLEGTRLNRVAP